MNIKEIRSESRTSVTCFRTLLNCYSQALETSGLEQMYNCIAGITFVAFTMEAMMNHYGLETIKNWNKKERKGSREKNHNLVFKELGALEIMKSKDYLYIKNAYSFRDNIVHGKTRSEQLTFNMTSRKIPDKVREVMSYPTKIEQQATIEVLEKYIESLQNIELKIEKILDYHIYPLSVTGLRSW